MHTLMVIGGGCLLLALFLLAARIFGILPGRVLWMFVPVWLAIAIANMMVGVWRAGYSFLAELPIMLVVFAVPAAQALILRSRLRG